MARIGLLQRMLCKCMVGQSGIPTIEYPALYRQSLQHLLEEVRPKRLYLGHHFRNANGAIDKSTNGW